MPWSKVQLTMSHINILKNSECHMRSQLHIKCWTQVKLCIFFHFHPLQISQVPYPFAYIHKIR